MNKEKEESFKKEEKEEKEEKDKESRKKKKEERRTRKYSEIINYPNMNVEIISVNDPDIHLFNNLFDENQLIYENDVKRYLFCSTIFIIYGLMGFMYYTYIY